MLMPPASVAPLATARAAAARTAPEFAVTLVGHDELADHQGAWEDLVTHALEPNCFYEPWMLLPALRHFGQDLDLETALVYRREPGRPPLLCGLIPWERRRRLHGIPVRLLTSWKHLHCILCTPLLHRDHASEALRALLRWAGADRRGATLIEFPFVPGEGPFAQLLINVINDLGCLTYPTESFTRALLRPGADADAYIQSALAPKHRRELGRMRRRLAELGRLEVRRLNPDDDPAPWLQQFLALEAAGWKGTERTALGCAESERAYFTTIVNEAHRRGQLMMLGLFLDDKPLALKCNFRTGAGAFTFKIAFDELYDKYSPGVQLELDNIAQAHQMPGLEWMDSCAIADHSMIDRLWTERRTIQNVLVAPGGWRGNLLVGLLPLLRAVKRTLWRRTRID